MYELTHIFLAYIQNLADEAKNESTYIMGIGPLLDMDNILIRLPKTRQIYPKKVLSDYIGLHGDCLALSEYAMQNSHTQDLRWMPYHLLVDIIGHNAISEHDEKIRENLRGKILKPRLTRYKPDNTIVHYAFEKVPEMAIYKYHPWVRRKLIKSYLFALPKAPYLGQMFSDFYQQKGYDISPRTFTSAIKFAIGFGLGRQMTMNYLRRFPKYDERDEKESNGEIILKDMMERWPDIAVPAGIVVPENGNTSMQKGQYNGLFDIIKKAYKETRFEDRITSMHQAHPKGFNLMN